MLQGWKAIPRASWRDGARRGAQSAVAAVATYAAMRALGMEHEFVGILSAALILHPSIGGTMGEAGSRLVATVVGSLAGLLALIVLPLGWGTPGALAVSLFVIGMLAGTGSNVGYGAVAAVAIALAPVGQEVESAVTRALAIALGSGIGVLTAFIVWPDRAEARFERHLRQAMRAAAARLSDTVGAAMGSEPGEDVEAHLSDYSKAAGQAEEALEAARWVDREGMKRRLDALRRLHEAIVVLDWAAGDDGPPVAGAERLTPQVDLLRRDACAVLSALAEGKEATGERTEEMDRALSDLQGALREDDPSSDLHRGRNVVAFGLWQVRRALRELIEAARDPCNDKGR